MRLAMRVLLLSLPVFLLLLTVPGDAPGQKDETTPDSVPEPQPKQQPGEAAVAEAKATELVEQLGADSWADRTASSKQLMKGGEQISVALRRGLQHADAEVRRRCRRILVDRVKSELQVGIAGLLADTEGKDEHALPGWARYRKDVGNNDETRKLFVEMLKDEPALMFACEAGGKVASDAANARGRQVIGSLYNRFSKERRVPSKGTISALVFAAAHPEVTDEDGLLNGQWMSNLVRQSAFVSMLTSKPASGAAQKLIGLWLRGESDEQGDIQRIRIAVTYQIPKDGLGLAVRLVVNGKQGNTSALTTAFEGVSRMGGREYAALLLPYLEDKRGLGVRIVNKQRIQMEVRDIALAWLIYATKQEPATYNMPNAKRWFDMLKQSPTRVTSTSYFYFASAAKRDEALKKWEEWLKKNPLPELPADAKIKPSEQKPGAAANPQVAGGVKPGAVLPVEPKEEKDTVPVADRARMQMLRRAQDLLVENPGHVEAISLIGRLLTEDREWIFRTEGETPVYRTLRSEAEDIISRLTPAQLDLYEQQFGTLARVDLDDAIASGTHESVAAVVQKYFFTRAGAEAAYWIASMQIDRGQFFPGALWLSRIRRSHPSANRYEPMLSLLLAFCWHESGVSERAEQVLTALRASGTTSVEVFGEKRRLPSRSETGKWLASLFEHHGSRGVFPVPAETEVSINERPAERTRIETIQDAKLESALEMVEDLHRQFGVAAIPQVEPVVVGDAVIFRTLKDIQCVSLSTNETLWKSSILSGLDTLLASSGASSSSSGVVLARALREWLWDRSAASSLVTDGRRIFAVEDVASKNGGTLPAMEILPNGMPTLREGAGKSHNRLTAWDVKTGKVIWECGGPESPRLAEGEAKTDSADLTRPLAGVRFLAAPQPLGDQLCVIGQVDDLIELLLIDSGTGQLVWRSTLHVVGESSPSSFIPGMPFGKVQVQPINSSGSAPVLHNDAVFVYVGGNRYVACDLATRRILWAYEEKRHEQPGALNMRNINLFQQFASKQMTQPDRWQHAKPTVVKDRVLITPPVTDLLVCLDRDSGTVAWDTKREDGLFVAGVVDGVAIIVGRSSVRGIRVASGEPAWKAVALPDGLQPAGRGILIPASRSRSAELHLPQANGNVAVLEIASGRWGTRQWQIEGYPGNIMAGPESIVSQDVRGITIFARTENRREKVMAALAANPKDATALISAAEISLHANELQDAIGYASRAVESGGGDRAQQRLAQSLAVSVNRESSESAEEAALKSAGLLSGKHRARVLRTVAVSQGKRGATSAALESWLKLIAAQPRPEKNLEARSFVWRVREDRWIQAELAELFGSAADADRKSMSERLLKFRETATPAVYVRFFGFHESANHARLALAETRRQSEAWLGSEQILIPVAESGLPDERVAATQKLAELSESRKQIGPAHQYAKRLAGPLAKFATADGQTGKQLAESLLEKIAHPLKDDSAWPVGPMKIEEFKLSTQQRTKIVTGYAMNPELRRDDVQGGTVLLDSRLSTLFARDAMGREKWKVSVKEPVTSSIRYLRYAVRYQQSRCSRQGQLTVAWIGDQVCAIDGFTKSSKPLWTQQCYLANPLDPQGVQFRPRFPQRGTMKHQDAQKLPLVVTPGYVSFQRGRKLMAVDPLDGSPLWWRDDLPAGCDLFGDGEFLFVRKPGEATAHVLRALDGKKLGTREVPEIDDRVLSSGRRCVSAKTSGDQLQVVAKDLWTGKVLWQRSLPKNAGLHIAGPGEVAMLKPDGQFQVVDADNGDVIVEAALTEQKNLSSLIVKRRMDRFVVIASEPEKVNKAAGVIMPQIVPGQAPVNGDVFILDRDGKQISQTRFESQAIKLNQPEQLPLLILFRRYQTRKAIANGRFTYQPPKTKLALLDVRTGRTVHQFDKVFGSDIDYQLDVKPDQRQMELTTRTGGLRIHWTKP